jgi:hypothetical protein
VIDVEAEGATSRAWAVGVACGVEDLSGQQVHREAEPLLLGERVRVVAEHVEQHADPAGADPDLAEDAVLGDRAHDMTLGVRDGPHEPVVGHRVVPVPRLDRDRRAAPGQGHHRGALGAGAGGVGHREQLGAGVEHRHLVHRDARALGDPGDLGRGGGRELGDRGPGPLRPGIDLERPCRAGGEEQAVRRDGARYLRPMTLTELSATVGRSEDG